MTENLQTIKDIALIAAPLTGAIVETWIKPKLVMLQKYLKTDKAVFENALSTKFDEYLQRTYEKNALVNVLVFQNQKKRLEEIYIPQTVHQASGPARVLINRYKSSFLPEHKRILIRDTAGMGKSTILKFLFVSCISSNKGIPVFIELRKLKAAESIIQYICNELNPLDDEFDKDFILQLIRQGDFVFFLDGYDEIPFGDRDAVTGHLLDFISKARNNLFMLSSRPDSSLASFQNFEEFRIQPLQTKEAFRLLKRYDKGGELSSEIISKLKSGLLKNLGEFLGNPFLVSLLFKSYQFKRAIPFKKHVFYRQVYDALFESHDLTKGGPFIREKYSKLDSEAFHKVLRALGFITVKLGQIEFDKDRMLALLREARGECAGLDFNEASLLKDLTTTVPLFNSEGDYYKWSHKSIQEYFAAQFICVDAKSLQNDILRKIVEGVNIRKYFNVLDLCYDIDYESFRQTIISDLLSKFLAHYDRHNTKLNRHIANKLINERKALTFASVNVVVLRDPVGSVVSELRARDSLRAKGIDIDGYYDVKSAKVLLSFTKEEEVLIDFLGSKKEEITEPVKAGEVEGYDDEQLDYMNYDDEDEDQEEDGTEQLSADQQHHYKPRQLEFLDDDDGDEGLDVYTAYMPPYQYSREIETITERSIQEGVEDYCLVDENSNSILNQADLFPIVNLFLRFAHSFVLNAPKCRQLKNVIDEEVRKARSQTLLRGI
jgi:hypothetical protein